MPILKALAVGIFLSLSLNANARQTCTVKSMQMKLVRECFTGDMALNTSTGSQFITDISEPDGANYCFNAFVMVDQSQGKQVRIRVLKEDDKGLPQIHSYSIYSQELPKTKEIPIALQGLKGTCYSNQKKSDPCSKILGFGRRELPMVLRLEKKKSKVMAKGLIQDRKIIEMLESKALPPAKEVFNPAEINPKLVQEMKGRLLLAAKKGAAKANGRRKLASDSEQYRYCSMAMDSFMQKNKIPDPFSAQDKVTLGRFDRHLNLTRIPASAPAKGK